MMKKILGYIAVLMAFFWVMTANSAPIVASISDSNGVLTIDGFADGDPTTLNFLFDFADTNNTVDSGVVSIFEPIVIGQNYAVHVGFMIPALPAPNPGPVFSADFNMISQFAFSQGSATIDQILGGLIGQGQTHFTPQNAFLTVLGDTMQLLTVDIGMSAGFPTLALSTVVINGTTLINYLNHIDGALNGGVNGIVSTAFTDSHAEVSVPEPTALLLLGSGLLVMFGYSKKRA